MRLVDAALGPPEAGSLGEKIGELWAELLADPGDLGVRMVLADALTAAGDPQGEFIALQLADDAAPNLAARSAATRLLAANIGSWARGIPGDVSGEWVFRRGFLSEVTLHLEELERATLEAPAWRTVDTLTIDRARGYGALLDRMPLLERLSVRGGAPGPGGPWPSVRVLAQGWEAGLPDLSLFPNLELWICALPKVIHVGKALARVYRFAAKARLTALALCVGPHEVDHAVGEGEGVDELPPFGRAPITQLRVLEAFLQRRAMNGLPHLLRISHGPCDLRGHGWVVELDDKNRPEARLDWAGGESWEYALLGPLLAALQRAGVWHAEIHRGQLDDAFVGLIEDLGIPGIWVTVDGAPVDLGAPPYKSRTNS